MFECVGLGEEKVRAIYNRQVAMMFYSESQGKDIFVLELVDDAQQNLLVQHDSKVITSKNVIFTSNLKLPHWRKKSTANLPWSVVEGIVHGSDWAVWDLKF